MHSLEANQSLLNQCRNEYVLLKNQLADHPSETLKRKMRDLIDKIRLLEEDSAELKSFLPPSRQAQGFLEELMTRKNRAEETRHIPRQRIPADDEEVFKMHEKALKCVSEKRYNEALEIYQDIVIKNPDDDQAYLIMGHTYLLTGQYQKAERAFNYAVNIDPQNINEITPFYENMVLQNPDDDMAYTELGYAYLIVGNLGKAQSAFGEAVHINPENAPAQRGSAFVRKLLSGR